MMNFFFKKRTMLVELGNCFTNIKFIESSFGRNKISNEISFLNPFYKNGIVKDRPSFLENIRSNVKNIDDRFMSNVVLGIDSSYIKYQSFHVKKGSPEKVLEKISSMDDDSKIIYHGVHDKNVFSLSIQRPILQKLYSVFEDAGLHVSKFVPIKYLQASLLDMDKTSLIVNIGYRATNISVFKDKFLLSCNTVIIGIENIALAIAEKSEISLEHANQIITEISLNEKNDKDWIKYGEKSFEKKKISYLLNFYFRAFIRKILDTSNLDKINTVVICGWTSNLSGIDVIFQKLLPNVNVVLESSVKHNNDICDLI